MSVANLTRYTIFKNEHCNWDCGLMPQHDGELVKFEEAKEAQTQTGADCTPSASHSSDYAAALRVAAKFADTGNSCAPLQIFIEHCKQRLNAKIPHCT